MGNGITVGRKDKHRSILGQRTALQAAWGGAEQQAQPCCDPGALALCPVGAGTAPGPAWPLPEPLPGLGWLIRTARAGREPAGWPHCSAGSEPQAGAA